MNNCLACQLNDNSSSVPGGTIKEYEYWILQHIINPIPVKGWLILKTKRHVDGITGMNNSESKELGVILNSITKTLKEVSKAAQIYICCFTEEVSHLHIHIIPRYSDEMRKGPSLFQLLKEVKQNPSKAVNQEEVIEFTKKISSMI